jgi:hypothetical protein
MSLGTYALVLLDCNRQLLAEVLSGLFSKVGTYCFHVVCNSRLLPVLNSQTVHGHSMESCAQISCFRRRYGMRLDSTGRIVVMAHFNNSFY